MSETETIVMALVPPLAVLVHSFSAGYLQSCVGPPADNNSDLTPDRLHRNALCANALSPVAHSRMILADSQPSASDVSSLDPVIDSHHVTFDYSHETLVIFASKIRFGLGLPHMPLNCSCSRHFVSQDPCSLGRGCRLSNPSSVKLSQSWLLCIRLDLIVASHDSCDGSLLTTRCNLVLVLYG